MENGTGKEETADENRGNGSGDDSLSQKGVTTSIPDNRHTRTQSRLCSQAPPGAHTRDLQICPGREFII